MQQIVMHSDYIRLLQKYVHAYIDMFDATLYIHCRFDHDYVGRSIDTYNEIAKKLMQLRKERYADGDIPNLEGMLDEDGKVNVMKMSILRTFSFSDFKRELQRLEILEAYSYAFSIRKKMFGGKRDE